MLSVRLLKAPYKEALKEVPPPYDFYSHLLSHRHPVHPLVPSVLLQEGQIVEKKSLLATPLAHSALPLLYLRVHLWNTRKALDTVLLSASFLVL